VIFLEVLCCEFGDMDKTKLKNCRWQRRKKRVRKHVYGSADQPRLTVFRSLRHMYAQIVDDDNGVTLVSASSMAKDFGEEQTSGGNVAGAAAVGDQIAKKAMAVGICQVVFDRNGYQYHGRVKALADASRKAGLKF